MAQPEATDNKNISKNNGKNIWRINKNSLPLHPQSREMRQRHGGRTPEGARLRLENPSKSAGLRKADEKNFRKNLEDEGKSPYLCTRNSTECERKFFERFTYTTSSTSIKEDIPSKKYLSSNKKGILG